MNSRSITTFLYYFSLLFTAFLHYTSNFSTAAAEQLSPHTRFFLVDIHNLDYMERTVLCLYDDHRREVKLPQSPASSPATSDVQILNAEVSRVFKDVIPTSSDLLLQIKSNRWDCFVDIGPADVIPHQSLIKISVKQKVLW